MDDDLLCHEEFEEFEDPPTPPHIDRWDKLTRVEKKKRAIGFILFLVCTLFCCVTCACIFVVLLTSIVTAVALCFGKDCITEK